jgi:hypothetical protein
MMLAGAETAFSVQSILLLLSWIDITSADLSPNVQRSNPLNIDWDPAPPPADGPPLSAGASRDKALLPAQISGIVGAYLLSLIVVAFGIFLARRKVRQQIGVAYKGRDIEMLATNFGNQPNIFGTSLQDTSPVSPLRVQTNFSWPTQEKSPQEKGGPNPYVFPPASPRSTTSPYSPTTPPSSGDPNVDSRIVERDQGVMARDLESIYAHVMEQEDAKAAGMSVEDLPPPTQLRGVGPAPPNPNRIGSPSKKIEKQRPANIMVSEDKPSKTSRASSIISSIISPRKSSFKKEMQISSPLQSPRDATYHQRSTTEEREPLSPRFYAPPPPPPIPTDQVPFQPPGRQNSQVSVASQTRTIAEQLEPYGPGAQSAFPKKTTTPVSFASQISGPSLPSSPKPQQSHFAPSTYSATPSSAASSTRQLPFRQFEPALTSPSYASFQQSTKTTVFERKAADTNRGPATGGLRTGGMPWSPDAVPYSPYQPFSPVIPVTPRLVTKEDRKMMKKQEKKLGIVQSPELVEDDLWDSGY